jgi:hypothetical protein
MQIETGLTVAREESDDLSLPTLLRFGLSDRFELRVESDVAGHADGDTELAPIAVGFKLRVKDGAFPLSILASVQPPSGGGNLQTSDFEGDVRLVSDIDLGHDLTLTPNVGVSLAEGGDTTAAFAMTLERAFGNKLPFVDFEVQSDSDETSLLADAGVAWIVRPDVQLDLSAGVELTGDAYPEWFIAAGFSRRF